MKTLDKVELANKVDDLLYDHTVEWRTVSVEGGWDDVQYCHSCGYLNESNHAANIVLEFTQNVYEDALLAEKARAWDKGWAKGSQGNGVRPMRIGWNQTPPNANRNPYRHQLQAKEKYDTDRKAD